MNRLWTTLLGSLTACILSSAYAQSPSMGFMTPRDIVQTESGSQLSLQNNRSTTATAYGLYIRQYGYVTPGDTCDHATPIYASASNITAGSVVMPIPINPGKRAIIGKNYLYNMIYEAIYYVNIIIPSSPPGCALPGCSWGTDVTSYNWCIYLGALGPVRTTTGYTASVPPSTVAASTGSYDYNLISTYVTLGPIACNDQTLTCTAESQQVQPFP